MECSATRISCRSLGSNLSFPFTVTTPLVRELGRVTVHLGKVIVLLLRNLYLCSSPIMDLDPSWATHGTERNYILCSAYQGRRTHVLMSYGTHYRWRDLICKAARPGRRSLSTVHLKIFPDCVFLCNTKRQPLPVANLYLCPLYEYRQGEMNGPSSPTSDCFFPVMETVPERRHGCHGLEFYFRINLWRARQMNGCKVLRFVGAPEVRQGMGAS